MNRMQKRFGIQIPYPNRLVGSAAYKARAVSAKRATINLAFMTLQDTDAASARDIPNADSLIYTAACEFSPVGT